MLYRLGRHYLSQASPQALENAFDKFQQVIEINPDHTDALLGIVEAHFPLVLSGYTGPGIREQLERMAALAREAVKRQPGYWRTHAVLGAVSYTHLLPGLPAIFSRIKSSVKCDGMTV